MNLALLKKEVYNSLNKVCKDFNLEFRKSWFSFISSSFREKEIITYLVGCPDPSHLKISEGSGDPRIRALRINEYLSSEYFIKKSESANNEGGLVIDSETFLKLKKGLNNLKDLKIKKELLPFYKELKSKLEKNNSLILLVYNKNKINHDLIKRIMLHEAIHITLKNNGIYFQDIKHDLWVYDEGLTTYLENYTLKTLGKLNEKPCSKMHGIYLKHAKFFQSKLSKIKNPKERYGKIREILQGFKS